MWTTISLIIAGGLGILALVLLLPGLLAKRPASRERISKREARIELQALSDPNPMEGEIGALLAEARSLVACRVEEGELPSLEALASLRNLGAAAQLSVLRGAGRADAALSRAGIRLDSTLDALVHTNTAVQDLYAVAARPRAGLAIGEITDRLKEVEAAVAELKTSNEEAVARITERRMLLSQLAGVRDGDRNPSVSTTSVAGHQPFAST